MTLFNRRLWLGTLTCASRGRRRRGPLFCERNVIKLPLWMRHPCMSAYARLNSVWTLNWAAVVIHTDAARLYTVHTNSIFSLSAGPLCGLQPPRPIHVATTNQCFRVTNSAEYAGVGLARLMRGLRPGRDVKYAAEMHKKKKNTRRSLIMQMKPALLVTRSVQRSRDPFLHHSAFYLCIFFAFGELHSICIY